MNKSIANNKSWTNHYKVLKKSSTGHEQGMNKSWTGNKQAMNKARLLSHKKSWKIDEQLLWTSRDY